MSINHTDKFSPFIAIERAVTNSIDKCGDTAFTGHAISSQKRDKKNALIIAITSIALIILGVTLLATGISIAAGIPILAVGAIGVTYAGFSYHNAYKKNENAKEIFRKNVTDAFKEILNLKVIEKGDMSILHSRLISLFKEKNVPTYFHKYEYFSLIFEEINKNFKQQREELVDYLCGPQD